MSELCEHLAIHIKTTVGPNFVECARLLHYGRRIRIGYLVLTKRYRVAGIHQGRSDGEALAGTGRAFWFDHDKHTTVRDKIKRIAEDKVNCDGIPDLVPQAYRRRMIQNFLKMRNWEGLV